MKRNIVSLLVIFAMVLSAVPIKASSAYWTDEGNYSVKWYSNSSNGEYIIESTADFAGLAVIVNGLNGESQDDFSGKKIYVKCDIDLSGYLWTPVGSQKKQFLGSIDGSKLDSVGNFLENHTVKNLKITDEITGAGLFGYNGGTIKNFTLSDLDISSGTSVGGICGLNTGTILNCKTSGEVVGSTNVGGVVGKSDSGKLINCVNNCDVSAKARYVGGIAGYLGKSCEAYTCFNLGEITGEDDYVGGICGINYYLIERCANLGNVCVKYNSIAYIGGVVGSNYSSGKIMYSYSVGEIMVGGDSCKYVGGLAGGNKGSLSGNYFLSRHYPVGKSSGSYVGEEPSGVNCFLSYERELEYYDYTYISLESSVMSSINMTSIVMPTSYSSSKTTIANVSGKKITAGHSKEGICVITGSSDFTFTQSFPDFSKDESNTKGESENYSVEAKLGVSVEKGSSSSSSSSSSSNSYYSVEFDQYKDTKNGVSARASIAKDEYKYKSTVSVSVVLTGVATKMGRYTVSLDSPDVSRISAVDSSYVLLPSGKSVYQYLEFKFTMPSRDVEEISVELEYSPQKVEEEEDDENYNEDEDDSDDSGDFDVTAPVFSPTTKNVAKNSTITISSNYPSSKIYYTTNGDTPTTSSDLYSEPIRISKTTTIKAFCVYSGNKSSVVTQKYTVSLASIEIRDDAKTKQYIRSATSKKFEPDSPVTRYIAIKALNYLLKVERIGDFTLSDVSEDYKTTVSKFIGAGIVSGYTDDTFRGDNPLTRGELAKMICVALNVDEESGDSDFWDLHGHWSEGYVSALYKKGYLTGYSDMTYHPDEVMTRAEFVVMINRIVGRDEEPQEEKYEDLPSYHWAFNDIMNACIK